MIRQKTTRPAAQSGPTEEQAELAFAAVQAIPLTLLEEEGQKQRAWELAKALGLPTVYDAHYLALAELRRCGFWTTDDRLYRKCRQKLPYVRHLDDAGIP